MLPNYSPPLKISARDLHGPGGAGAGADRPGPRPRPRRRRRHRPGARLADVGRISASSPCSAARGCSASRVEPFPTPHRSPARRGGSPSGRRTGPVPALLLVLTAPASPGMVGVGMVFAEFIARRQQQTAAASAVAGLSRGVPALGHNHGAEPFAGVASHRARRRHRRGSRPPRRPGPMPAAAGPGVFPEGQGCVRRFRGDGAAVRPFLAAEGGACWRRRDLRPRGGPAAGVPPSLDGADRGDAGRN